MSIPTPNFNEAMSEMAAELEKALKVSLLRPYKFAPGFTNRGTVYGVAPKVASGALLESITAFYDPSTKSIKLEMLDYWKYVNDGRKPGRYAPLDAIENWIRQKGLKGRDKKGRFITNESFAWGINTNIKKFGIAPTFFVDNTTNRVEKEYEQKIANALNKDYEDYFNSILEAPQS